MKTPMAPWLAQIVHETTFKLVHRHLLPRLRQSANDNEARSQ
jgi:hypothetical protein